MPFTKESDFENALIQTLSQKGWESEILRYPTEEDLLKNWAEILYHNNNTIDRLNDCPLTDTEMQQIIEQTGENIDGIVARLEKVLEENGAGNGNN